MSPLRTPVSLAALLALAGCSSPSPETIDFGDEMVSRAKPAKRPASAEMAALSLTHRTESIRGFTLLNIGYERYRTGVFAAPNGKPFTDEKGRRVVTLDFTTAGYHRYAFLFGSTTSHAGLQTRPVRVVLDSSSPAR